MKKIIVISVSVIVLLGLAGLGWYYFNFKKYAPETYVAGTKSGEVMVDTNTGETTAEIKSFTFTDIAAHKDASSCYSAISGNVYDLTAFVNMHPGGKDKILSICGTDGTEKFMNKHKGGNKFMAILARFKIGTVTE